MKAAHGSAPTRALVRWRSLLIGMGATTWGVAVAWQLHSAMTYEATPGGRADQVADADKSSKPRLVVVVHPECPCTKATLGQLREIVARQEGKLDATVVVAREPDHKGQSSNEALARSIPGVKVTAVFTGDQATLGAKTSGESFYFGADGKLAYHGGLTEGRGVQVPSRGAYCLQKSCRIDAKSGEVYGCPLQ